MVGKSKKTRALDTANLLSNIAVLSQGGLGLTALGLLTGFFRQIWEFPLIPRVLTLAGLTLLCVSFSILTVYGVRAWLVRRKTGQSNAGAPLQGGISQTMFGLAPGASVGSLLANSNMMYAAGGMSRSSSGRWMDYPEPLPDSLDPLKEQCRGFGEELTAFLSERQAMITPGPSSSPPHDRIRTELRLEPNFRITSTELETWNEKFHHVWWIEESNRWAEKGNQIVGETMKSYRERFDARAILLYEQIDAVGLGGRPWEGYIHGATNEIVLQELARYFRILGAPERAAGRC